MQLIHNIQLDIIAVWSLTCSEWYSDQPYWYGTCAFDIELFGLWALNIVAHWKAALKKHNYSLHIWAKTLPANLFLFADPTNQLRINRDWAVRQEPIWVLFKGCSSWHLPSSSHGWCCQGIWMALRIDCGWWGKLWRKGHNCIWRPLTGK